MRIKHFTNESDKQNYDSFISSNAFDGGLLQSWDWGEFKKESGAGVKRICIVNEQNAIIAGMNVLIQKFAYFNKIYYVPRGPVISLDLVNSSEEIREIMLLFFEELKKTSVADKILFLRIDPGFTTSYFKRNFLEEFGFNKSKYSIQPAHTLVADITASEQELLNGMKQKTRYNINIASKKGVTVRISQDEKDLNVFLQILQKTEKRHQRKFYGPQYFKDLFKISAPQKNIYFVTARHQGMDVASNLMVINGKTAYYLYGASDYAYRNIMAPYLLQWESFKKAKELGCEFYDFWGIAGPAGSDTREKTWEGFSRFKKGFAPNQPITEYLGTWELPYKEKTYRFWNMFR